jgi:hypothetical protein
MLSSKARARPERSRKTPRTREEKADLAGFARLTVPWTLSILSRSVTAETERTHPRHTTMAKRKAKKATARKASRKPAGKKSAADFIISKSRTKNAAGINVSGEFYGALDSAVRGMIKQAEARAVNNGRKTLRPHDL